MNAITAHTAPQALWPLIVALVGGVTLVLFFCVLAVASATTYRNTPRLHSRRVEGVIFGTGVLAACALIFGLAVTINTRPDTTAQFQAAVTQAWPGTKHLDAGQWEALTRNGNHAISYDDGGTVRPCILAVQRNTPHHPPLRQGAINWEASLDCGGTQLTPVPPRQPAP